MLIAGKGGAGKSTLTNVVLDLDPEDPEATKESGVGKSLTEKLTLIREAYSSLSKQRHLRAGDALKDLRKLYQEASSDD